MGIKSRRARRLLAEVARFLYLTLIAAGAQHVPEVVYCIQLLERERKLEKLAREAAELRGPGELPSPREMELWFGLTTDPLADRPAP